MKPALAHTGERVDRHPAGAGKANGALQKELNLPSRNDMIEIGVRLQRIEDAIEQLAKRLGGVAPAGRRRTQGHAAAHAKAAECCGRVRCRASASDRRTRNEPTRGKQPARKSPKKKA